MDNRFKTMDWVSDYKNLKHYRYIRNQIVHENNINEDSICNEDDLMWVEQFHKRIINQTDPLALYHKAMSAFQQHYYKSIRKEESYKSIREEEPYNYHEKNDQNNEIVKFVLTIIIITLIVIAAILLWYKGL